MSKKMLLVSGDAHAGAMPEDYRNYFDPEYRSTIADLEVEQERFMQNTIMQQRYSAEQLERMDERKAIRSGGLDGTTNVARRMKEMDAEGVAAELLCPGHQYAVLPFFSLGNRPAPADLRAAGAKAYHRYLAEMMAEAGGRLVGLGEPGPCLDMDATVKELHWIADHGFRSVQPPGNTGNRDLPPIQDLHYEPFWSACEDLNLVLTAHVGYGAPQQERAAFMNSSGQPLAPTVAEEEKRAARTAGLTNSGMLRPIMYVTRRLAAQMMISGVLDRHPKLKVVITECRADWVPGTIAQMDREFEAGELPTLKMKPSEYWTKHFYVTPSSPRRYEIGMRKEIGVNQLMLGTDYPHPEGTWPNTQDWIRTTFEGVSEADARRILGENAVDCYGLDRAKLEKIAERIGPEASDMLGGAQRVKPEVIADFHRRSDFDQQPEQVDPTHVRDFFRPEEHMVMV
jgi:predicted TIM-barrel fold metal-dependent hydrolase